jgi:hypothetical protein
MDKIKKQFPGKNRGRKQKEVEKMKRKAPKSSLMDIH